MPLFNCKMETKSYYLGIEGTALNLLIATDSFASYVRDHLGGISSGFTGGNASRKDYLVGSAHIAYQSTSVQTTPQGVMGTIKINIVSLSPLGNLETEILNVFEGKPEIATLALVIKGPRE